MKRLVQVLVLSVLTCVSSSAQFPDRRAPVDPNEIKRQKEQEKNLNTQRVKDIKQDTDKLVDLANELKKSVDAASDNTLSLEVIRKTEEIEKLAKKVRGKMKETYEAPDSRLPDASSH